MQRPEEAGLHALVSEHWSRSDERAEALVHEELREVSDIESRPQSPMASDV